MRKFVITAVVILALTLCAYYGVFEAGLYIPQSGDIAIAFRANGDAVEHYDSGEWTPLTIRGVELDSGMAGRHNTDYAPTQADYTRWMQWILDMGANTIYAPLIMDDDFYNALWDVNQRDTLYLIQGVTVSDEVNNRTETAFDSGLMDGLIQNGKAAVDIIHGRRDIASGGVGGSGSYRRDVSAVVIGYLIGSGWQEDMIAYTDHSEPLDEIYQGKYFSSIAGASPTERMAAQVMDEITRYESEKYLTQRPAGVMTDPTTDFLRYEEVYARQLGKYAFIDPNDITATSDMAAGQITGYTLYNYCTELERCLTQEQKEMFASALRSADADEPYGGLIPLLAAHDDMPIIGFYSYSSARGTVDGERLTEREQGERYAAVSALLERSNWAGGIITAWQDGWTRRSWNTAYATDTAESRLWRDIQTAAKNTGLMAFEPGESPTCVLDGDRSEWTEKDRIQTGEYPMSIRQDATGIYLLIENVTRERTVYVPFDVSPEVGSASCESPALSFDRDADFLLVISGQDDTRLLVQERYDPVRMNFLYSLTGEDPFIDVPDKDSARFVPVIMPIENTTLLDKPVANETAKLNYIETGRLLHGCNNPNADDCESQADFCFGVDFVEVRIPWLLLNFGDPAKLRIHGDYYANYGVELQAVKGIYTGAGSGETAIQLAYCRLSGWGQSEPYRERLKDSYYVLQRLWTADTADEGGGG